MVGAVSGLCHFVALVVGIPFAFKQVGGADNRSAWACGQGNPGHALGDGIIDIGLRRVTLLGLHHGESQSSHQRNHENLLHEPVIYKNNMNNSSYYRLVIKGLCKGTKFSPSKR